MSIAASKISCGVEQLFDLMHGPEWTLITAIRDRSNELLKYWEANYNVNLRLRKCPETYPKTVKQILDRDSCFQQLFPASYIFSDAVCFGHGARLAGYVKEHNLGTVVESAPALNTNSRHLIQTWVWNVDKEAMKQWFLNGMAKKYANPDNYRTGFVEFAEYK